MCHISETPTVARAAHCPACRTDFATVADFREHLPTCRSNDPSEANYYEAVRERNAAEAKLEKVATLVADLRFATGSEWVARMLDNILFPCQRPGEHCGECGCRPDKGAS